MLSLLVSLLVLVLIVGLLWWALSQIPLPPPFRVVVNVLVAIIAIVFLCGLMGWGWTFHPVAWRR